MTNILNKLKAKFSEFAQLRYLPIWHFGISFLIAVLLVFLVTVVWFPAPYHLLAGGIHLFWWMLGVDVVCGPLLTLILIRSTKSRRANAIDLILIAFIQSGALMYGIQALAVSRPQAIVFEVDRFRVISYSDIPEEEIRAGGSPEWLTPWQFNPPRPMGLRGAKSLDEKIASLDLALQGVDAAQRPDRWQEYALSKPDILQRARPLSEIVQKYPTQSSQINLAVNEAGCSAKCVWLPLVGRRSAEWIVLIDPNSAEIVGYLPFDGFF